MVFVEKRGADTERPGMDMPAMRQLTSNGWQPQLLYPWRVRPVMAALRQEWFLL
jgi:hypothetical protein